MRLLTTLWISCSFLLFACAQVPRPDTDLCVVNAPAGHRKCYNILKDYNDEGDLLPGAKPLFKPAKVVEDLNKNICTDPDGWANMKAYIRSLREELSACARKK